MSKIKAEMAARCELAMMGKFVPIKSNDEVQAMTAYIFGSLTDRDPNTLVDILDNAINKYQQNLVTHLGCFTVYDMPCIAYCLKSTSNDPEEQYPDPFTEDYGTGHPSAFCYVFNTADDWCSEFGDVFFSKKSDGYYHIATNS